LVAAIGTARHLPETIGENDVTLIPAQSAEIFWNDDEDLEDKGRTGGANVVVTDIRERQAEYQRTGKDPTRHYFASTGAHTEGWTTDVHPQSQPEGVFAANWLNRSATRESIKAALREFGKIEECEWARRMYETLDRRDRYDRGESETD
jgi:hypothetical protein